MAKFNITADVQVKVWQRCEFVVEAKTFEEAQEIIKANPLSTCVGYETLHDTEEALTVENFKKA